MPTLRHVITNHRMTSDIAALFARSTGDVIGFTHEQSA
jgi:hypothetical protein